MGGAAVVRQGGRSARRHPAHMRACARFRLTFCRRLSTGFSYRPQPLHSQPRQEQVAACARLGRTQGTASAQSGYHQCHRRSSRCSRDCQRSAAPASAACRAAAAPPAARAPHRAGNPVPLIILTAGFCRPPICCFADNKQPTMSSGGQMSQGVGAADERTTLLDNGQLTALAVIDHVPPAHSPPSCLPLP